MQAQQFAGKVLIVTGAGGGIGRATAALMASRGAAVVCGDIDEGSAVETARGIEDQGGRALAVPVDVSSEAGNAALVEAAERGFGRVDVAFLNAGILRRGTVMTTPASVFDEVIAVNLRGVFLGMRAVVPALRRAGGGAIVVTASSVALRADADLACYSASKHALIGLVQAAAGEMAPWNIRVNAICPGAVATAMAGTDTGPGSALAMVHPIGRIGTPEDIAELVAFLAGSGAAFITGAAYPVDGGLTALSVPRFRADTR
jgi:NAD(P)-dependent dehydrogenase (short-subunit alcohol dehydrogenase family)